MDRSIKVGDIVRHFKGGMYVIIAIGINTETNEEMVVYRDKSDGSRVFIREYGMFISGVDRDKYPDEKAEYRFEVVESKGEESSER